MKVLKFGGSSVANSENIEKVIAIMTHAAQKSRIAVVVSAFGKTTNMLIEAANMATHKNEDYKKLFAKIELNHLEVIQSLISKARQDVVPDHVKYYFDHLKTLLEGCFLLQELTPKTLAIISSYGELLSSYIISEAASEKGLSTVYQDSRELIIASDNFLNAEVDFSSTNPRVQVCFRQSEAAVILLPGFIASTPDGKTTTLGRGGSDFSAAIYAAAIGADELQIWTDVSGLYTSNPSIVKQAIPISHISYQEAMELSHFGAKVIYPPTIQPVLEKEIPIAIKNTFDPEHTGTLIMKEAKSTSIVKGISYIEDISLVTVQGSGMVGIPGFSKRLFEALSNQNINIILITQASSEHSICLGINEASTDIAKQCIDETFTYEIAQHKLDATIAEKNMTVIALVGDHMKSHQGLSGKMFSVLGKNNVNIRAIAQGASEKNISAVIHKNDAKKSLNVLHEAFFEEKIKQLHLFLCGVGNVGKHFLSQIQQQKKYLKKKLKLNIRVIGISNSTKMVFDENGIDLSNWEAQLRNGESTGVDVFLEKTKAYNLRNSVFIDNTASEAVSQAYEQYLRHNIGVVTCNKIACASSLENYKTLKSVSRKYNAPFLFETNVGAGLPIIDTLKNLVNSGDRIHKIKAVLSGSLNFIFNHFNADTTFHDIVVEAQKQGYTEPDPKIDLSGIDVARKILILARESRYELELDAVETDSFLPKECMATTNNESFYRSLKKHEAHFQKIYQEARNNSTRLKYVAEFNNGKARVGLQPITPEHPFYTLAGSDNIVLFFTDRYPENPMLIKGAGAGAAVTASGVFADVIRIGKV
ncbi:MAG: bifunctional aspartate kinase/homoserine dehydrogenase I [Flavobacteriaceae bacterium]|nr:MAG: bifunctional aspartate kinase/homoserine dehydrogenase I [Flavobacteriaceae bacterium]